jgi:hypothetical protein
MLSLNLCALVLLELNYIKCPNIKKFKTGLKKRRKALSKLMGFPIKSMIRYVRTSI